VANVSAFKVQPQDNQDIWCGRIAKTRMHRCSVIPGRVGRALFRSNKTLPKIRPYRCPRCKRSESEHYGDPAVDMPRRRVRNLDNGGFIEAPMEPVQANSLDEIGQSNRRLVRVRRWRI